MAHKESDYLLSFDEKNLAGNVQEDKFLPQIKLTPIAWHEDLVDSEDPDMKDIDDSLFDQPLFDLRKSSQPPFKLLQPDEALFDVEYPLQGCCQGSVKIVTLIADVVLIIFYPIFVLLTAVSRNGAKLYATTTLNMYKLAIEQVYMPLINSYYGFYILFAKFVLVMVRPILHLLSEIFTLIGHMLEPLIIGCSGIISGEIYRAKMHQYREEYKRKMQRGGIRRPV